MKPTFLADGANAKRLERAIGANHREWFRRCARAEGGEVHQSNGVTWVHSPVPSGDGMIWVGDVATWAARAQLDAVVAYYRDRRPFKSLLCWSLLPTRPRDLGGRLLARGFDWCWQPRWMWLDLDKLNEEHPRPPGLRVGVVEDEAPWDVDDLPYYSREETGALRALQRARPQRVWHFGAWLDGRPVGQTVLNLTTGPLGIAGIYSVGVVPAARNQGIGKAVVAAACRFAREMGCRHALLNGTGERMYRQVGFDLLGWGQTWFMRAEKLQAPPPTPTQVTFVEAVGRGDLVWLDALASSLDRGQMDALLPCGMTPLDVAVKTAQPASAEWLVAHGATLDVLSAWDLGWKERVRQLLAESPERANARFGDWRITPLHVAVERGDTELARLLLAARPDLTIEDTQFRSTALGWARHFQRTEIVALIEGRNG